MRRPYRPRTYRIISTRNDYLVAVRRFRIRTGRTVARMIGRILLALAVLAVTGFVFLVLIGLWDRYEQEITAGLSRIYERYLAWQAGFFRRRADTDVPAAAEAGRNRRGGKHQPRHVRCVVRGRQHRHRGWTRPQQR